MSDDQAVNHSWISSTTSNIQHAIDGSPTTTTPTSTVSSAGAPSRSCSSQGRTLKSSESKKDRLKSSKVVIPIRSGTKQKGCVRKIGDEVAEICQTLKGPRARPITDRKEHWQHHNLHVNKLRATLSPSLRLKSQPRSLSIATLS